MNSENNKKIKLKTPYIGLLPFSKNEVRYFFGRRKQTAKLIERLRENRFVAVIGESGSGKSSIVKAGLVPKLEAGIMIGKARYWHVVEMRPGKNPLQSLAKGLHESLGNEFEKNTDLPNSAGYIESRLNHIPKQALLELLERLIPDDDTAMLLVVDQFEEIFRFESDIHRDEAEKFATILIEAVKQQKLPIYVVITMRSEFIGDCSKFEGLPEKISESPFVVPRLDRKALEEAIEGPATMVNCEVEPALVNRLCNEVSITQDQLPIIQHLLMRLYLNRGKSNQLTMAEYGKVGGVSQALNNHVNHIYDQFDDKKQETTERLFRCLTQKTIEGNRVRRPTAIKDILKLFEFDKDLLYEVITELSARQNSFLISDTDELTDESIIDITHESLIRNWKRLKTWVDNEVILAHTYRRIGTEALVWQESGTLLSGRHLENANGWLQEKRSFGKITKAWCRRNWDEKWQDLHGTSKDDDYAKLIDDFFRACQINEDKIQRDKELEHEKKIDQARSIQVAIGLFALLMLGISIFAVIQWREADNQRKKAEIERIKTVKTKNFSIALSFATHLNALLEIEKAHSYKKDFGDLPLLMAAEAARHLRMATNWRDTRSICVIISAVLQKNGLRSFEIADCAAGENGETLLQKKNRDMNLHKNIEDTIEAVCQRVKRNLKLEEWYLYTGGDHRTYRPTCDNHLEAPYILALDKLMQNKTRGIMLQKAAVKLVIAELDKYKDKHAKDSVTLGKYNDENGDEVKWRWNSNVVYADAVTVFNEWNSTSGNVEEVRKKLTTKNHLLVLEYVHSHWSQVFKNNVNPKKVNDDINPVDSKKAIDTYNRFVTKVTETLVKESDTVKRNEQFDLVINNTDWNSLGADDQIIKSVKARALASICLCGAAYDEPKTVIPACNQAVELSNADSPYLRYRGMIYAIDGNISLAIKDFDDHSRWLGEQPSTENFNRERVITAQVEQKLTKIAETPGMAFRIENDQKNQIKLGCALDAWE